MIHRTHPGPGRRSRSRARRASRILLASAAVAALLGVDLPDAMAGPPLGVTAQAPPDAEADRVGALFAGGLDGGHFCTAAVVRSDGHDVIATAAHCVDRWDTTVFAPGYRDGEAPYGVWKLTGVYVAPGWRDGGDPDADIAFATVAPVDGGRTGAVEDLVGGFPVAAEQAPDATVRVIGYPRGQEAPLRCANTTALFSDTQRRIDCPDLSSGTSGSPWLVGGALAGVLGGHEAGGSVPEVSYSAVMGDQAVELYREASVTD
ncbi:trypsin-like serine peptidase [Streptomyces sp. NPDC088762]|uniref:trypsin-like serine peptidase n=1 Tax=Streptomyces sp. NPDC088762 TaxID=3365891 RepID=UPI003800C771